MNVIRKSYTHKKELVSIREYVNDTFHLEIQTKRRKVTDVRGRALYIKIALKVTKASQEEISLYINRDHSTVNYNANVIIPEIDELPEYVRAYKDFINGYSGRSFEISSNTKNTKASMTVTINHLQSQIKLMTEEISSLTENSNSSLTNNEKEYRKLSDSQKADYDKRNQLYFKSLEWKQGSNEFEHIECSQ